MPHTHAAITAPDTKLNKVTSSTYSIIKKVIMKARIDITVNIRFVNFVYFWSFRKNFFICLQVFSNEKRPILNVHFYGVMRPTKFSAFAFAFSLAFAELEGCQAFSLTILSPLRFSTNLFALSLLRMCLTISISSRSLSPNS